MCKTQQEKNEVLMKRKQILFLPPAIAASLRAGPGGLSYCQQLLHRAAPISGAHAVPRGCRESGRQRTDTARAEAEAYNELLASGATAAELDTLDYDSLLNLAGNGIMGYIEIPAIDVLLPICHGVGEDSLERGAGHMPTTSLPIGGRHAYCDFCPFRHGNSRMFTDLEQLEAGDVFYLHVLNEALSYEVDQILVVKPYQIDALKIDRGKIM